ncbi:MAG: glycosyltransferase [Bacteroidota bacterium]
MQKALIISYYWPPSGGSGVQRWMYFAKYLEENGIEPTVLTIDPIDGAYPAVDESLLEQVKHVKVIHTSGGFSLVKTYANLKGGSSKNQIPVGDFGNKNKTIFDRIAGYIRANYFIPDARVGWNKKAIPVAQKILQNEKFDIVITTGPPHSTHLIGLALRKQFPIHWLADFRDPWREVYYNKVFKRSARSEKKDARLEKEVLQHADTLLTVGFSTRELLQKKVTDASKVFAILNGFDSHLFDQTTGKRYDEFTIAHIGIWTLMQAHQEVFEALSLLLEEHPTLKVRFVLVGQVHQDIVDGLQKIERLIVDHRGKQSHAVAIQEIMNADVLLNCLALIPESKILISGKLMEYLASGNRVLAIGDPEGDAAQLMNTLPNAKMIAPGAVDSIKNTIFEWMQMERFIPTPSRELTHYSRKETAKQLAQLIKSRTHVS